MKVNLFAQCLGYKQCSTNSEDAAAADDDNDDKDLGDSGDDEKGESKKSIKK